MAADEQSLSGHGGSMPAPAGDQADRIGVRAFSSPIVDRLRASGAWDLPGGQLRLPRVFGLCRGVEHALNMLAQAVHDARADGARLVLLGQIIHNPWVNEHFRSQGVRLLGRGDLADISVNVRRQDVVIVPAFGVPPAVQRQLRAIGCRVVDTTCGNVRRLWDWALRAAAEGRGVLIYGHPRHDETVVTTSRLAEAGGSYVVADSLEGVRRFCDLLTSQGPNDSADPRELLGAQATNAASFAPFNRLAQVSQTTMLYEETMAVREIVHSALEARFGRQEASDRLLFEPTVCRATQERQSSALELCRSGLDLVIVVGGFGSSNTRNLYELAGRYSPAWFIEDASAIRSRDELLAFDPAVGKARPQTGWLSRNEKPRIGVLAGASTPEVVVGVVLERLAELLK